MNLPLVIIAGLSGSGKSTALDVFEDLGFFKIDGLPPALVPSLVSDLSYLNFSEYTGISLGLDLRQESFIVPFQEAVEKLKEEGRVPHVIFFEAKSDILVQRYASTRRPHPLEKENLGLEQALEIERERLQAIRRIADLVVDTSNYSIHNLRRTLQEKWKVMCQANESRLRVHLISFGFKYGTPSEADMVFDLRFLPNPFFDDALKLLSGRNDAVAQYVLESNVGKAFFAKLVEFLVFTIDQMEIEGRYRITIAIGCTGGRHRSVAAAEALAAILSKDYSVSLEHRHLEFD